MQPLPFYYIMLIVVIQVNIITTHIYIVRIDKVETLLMSRKRTTRVHNLSNGYDHYDTDNYTETGCCYVCCRMCCRSCCRCCRPSSDIVQVTPQTSNFKNVKAKVDSGLGTHQTATPRAKSVAPDTPKSTSDVNVSLIKEPAKAPAKEVKQWLPHANPVRNINTSTK